jgi:hypothetical protein
METVSLRVRPVTKLTKERPKEVILVRFKVSWTVPSTEMKENNQQFNDMLRSGTDEPEVHE